MQRAHSLTNQVVRTKDVINDETDNKTFDDFNLRSELCLGLARSGFTRPSPIQLRAIPFGVAGLDLVVQSKSGTGKTLVYVITALSAIDFSRKMHPQALILVPTREIAIQGARTALEVGSGFPDLKIGTFIGGMPLAEDKLKLRNCHFAIGTPGRIKRLIEDGFMITSDIRIIILDEADKFLEHRTGFPDDISFILSRLPDSKQILALSATFRDDIVDSFLFSRSKSCPPPTQIRPDRDSQVLLGVRQYGIRIRDHPANKRIQMSLETLLKILTTTSFSQCLVFSNYAVRARSLCDRLNDRGWPAVFLASVQDQNERLVALRGLESFRFRILLTTDLAARGVDAKNVDLVINADVPRDSVTYLHRIGRAGRYGTKGIAITFVSTSFDKEELDRISKETGSRIDFNDWNKESSFESILEDIPKEDPVDGNDGPLPSFQEICENGENSVSDFNETRIYFSSTKKGSSDSNRQKKIEAIMTRFQKMSIAEIVDILVRNVDLKISFEDQKFYESRDINMNNNNNMSSELDLKKGSESRKPKMEKKNKKNKNKKVISKKQVKLDVEKEPPPQTLYLNNSNLYDKWTLNYYCQIQCHKQLLNYSLNSRKIAHHV